MVAARTLWSFVLHLLAICASQEADDTGSLVSKCTSDAFIQPRIGRGVTVLSVSARPQYNFTSIRGGSLQPPLQDLTFCQVQLYLTHQADNDHVLVEVWLPLERRDWNGRMQATGGGGFATGMFGAHLGAAVKDGWAAVSTDGGHNADLDRLTDASWMLSDPGEEPRNKDGSRSAKFNWGLIHNLASRSPVDQILVAKSIIEQYYGEKPHHSYWNGCSTGGRQGYAIAQKYPDLVDGILAAAPAVSFVNVVMGALWPQVAMNTAKTYLSNCELEYFRAHAIKACEVNMDTSIGILHDPSSCPHWSPEELVGSAFECEGSKVVVTDAMAQVLQSIHDGPAGRFPGLDWGVPMTTLANTSTHHDGSRSPHPFRISASWLKYAVLRDQPHDIANLDEERLNHYWVSALADFGGVLNTDDPDLSKLRDSKTKMITWHGIDDQMIPYQNSLNYRKKIEGVMGGAMKVDDYFRLFLAPGVTHCGGGVGPNPKDPLDALIRWVEDNDPPDTLDAEGLDVEGELVTRDLCLWPATAQYLGISNVNRASSWSCVGGIQRPAAPEQATENEFDYGTMQQPQDGHVHGKGKEHGSDRTQQILGGLKDRIEALGMGLRVD